MTIIFLIATSTTLKGPRENAVRLYRYMYMIHGVLPRNNLRHRGWAEFVTISIILVTTSAILKGPGESTDTLLL